MCIGYMQTLCWFTGFPGSSVVKNTPDNAGDPSSIPGSGRSPEEGNGNPLQYSCLEKSHKQRSQEGYSLWGRRVWHNWTTEHKHAVLYEGLHSQILVSVGFWSQTPRIQGTTVSNTWPYIYVLNFLFEIISKLQKSCSNNTKNPHTVFIQINQILTLIHMCYIIHSLFIYNC